tara:strand:+ start:274 stop:693 length:420 start_codon:yes stop_codon:yes gene_type:complete
MEKNSINVSFDIETDLFEEINSKLSDLTDKIDNMEKTYVTLNTNLIQQNIKMSTLLYGKLEDPNLQNDQENLETQVKELYYYVSNNTIIVHGPGTFDNKTELSKYGSWNGNNKTWDLVIDKNVLLDKFPSIIFKSKENN